MLSSARHYPNTPPTNVKALFTKSLSFLPSVDLLSWYLRVLASQHFRVLLAFVPAFGSASFVLIAFHYTAFHYTPFVRSRSTTCSYKVCTLLTFFAPCDPCA